MDLKENLREIVLLGNIKANFNTYINYNEMTFIPYFKNNSQNNLLNAKVVDKISISEILKLCDDFILRIKNKNLNDFNSIDEISSFLKTVYPISLKRNDINISPWLKSDESMNIGWSQLLEHLQESKKEIFNNDHISDKFINIQEIGKDIDNKYRNVHKFIATYYDLVQQLSLSFLHDEDKKYIIKSINDYVLGSSPNMENLNLLYQEYQNKNLDYRNIIKNEIKNIDPYILVTNADYFIQNKLNEMTGNEIEQFLNEKILADNYDFKTISFTASQKINKVFLFGDKSIAYFKDNEYHTIKDNEKLSCFIDDIHQEAISFILRKKPKLINFFQNKIKEDKDYIIGIKCLFSFVDNYDVLKQYGFDLNKFKNNSFETIDDTINSLVYKNKVKQFAYSILSSKYKHHFNEKTEPHFQNLYDNHVTTSQLQDFVGRKVAALENNNDVINMLTGLANHFEGFTPEILSEKLEKFGINKLYDSNNIVVFEVENYDQCKEFGSTSWCIVRDIDYFNQYVTDNSDLYVDPENGKSVKTCHRQYIIYDFNKAATEIESMIGFTLDSMGNDYAFHYKNDDYINEKNTLLNSIVDHTIYANKERHVISKEKMDILEKTVKSKNNKHTIKP